MAIYLSLDVVIVWKVISYQSHPMFSMHHNKGKFTLKFIQFITIPNLFLLEVVQNVNIVLRENLIVICFLNQSCFIPHETFFPLILQKYLFSLNFPAIT